MANTVLFMFCNLTKTFNKFKPLCNLHASSISFNKVTVRNKSDYTSNPLEQDKSAYIDKWEVVKNPEEWKFVERLLPFSTVPEPQPKEHYPSGWTPPKEFGKNNEYFVERTKNHMVPCYLKKQYRGQLQMTEIRKIQGNIFKMHDDVKKMIAEQEGRKFASYVNEAIGVIRVKGDHVYITKKWLISKGF